MFKKIIKNNKGTALVFIMILVANALIIMSSIVFISAIQNRSGGAIVLTSTAFQKADSGLEYILGEIYNDYYNPATGSLTGTIYDLCTNSGNTFNVGPRSCSISSFSADVYFLDNSQNVLTDSDDIADIGYIKVVGEASQGSNTVSRSLRTTLSFNAP